MNIDPLRFRVCSPHGPQFVRLLMKNWQVQLFCMPASLSDL